MPKKIEMATKEAPSERIPSIRKPQIRRSVSFDYVQDSLTPEVRYFQYHFKGSPDSSHFFFFWNQCRKNSDSTKNDSEFHRFFMSDLTLSDNDFKNEMGLVWIQISIILISKHLLNSLNDILGTYLWSNWSKTWSTFDGIPKDYETRKSAVEETAKTCKTCREKIIRITFLHFYI